MGDISPHNTVNNKSVLLFVGKVLTKHMSIGPGQLKGLPHDEAAKDLVEPDCNRFQFMLFDMFQPVPVLRLADNEVFQLGVFEPDRVVGLDPG